MIKFLKKILRRIMKLDIYTNKYLKITNRSEMPFLAYTNWGLYLAEEKDFKRAAEKLETAVMMCSFSPAPCISLGLLYAKLKQYDKAEDVLKEALRRDSKSACAYSVLGSIYTAQNRLEEAEKLFKTAYKLAPSDADVCLNYGFYYVKLQNQAKAAEMFQKSKFYNPDNIHTLFILGVMYFETEKIEEALEEFLHIQEIEPEYKKLNYYLALCFQRLREYEKTVLYAEKAMQEEPSNHAVYVLAANAYFNLDKKDDVFRIYDLGEINGINNFEFFLSECTAAAAYRDNERAKKCAHKALILKPDDSEALYRTGECLKREGNIKEAVIYYNRAIEKDPDNAHALSDLGIIKYKNKEYEKALELMLPAAHSGRKYLYRYIADCFYKTGRIKKSFEYYEKMLEYYPESVETLINYAVSLLETDNSNEALRKLRRARRISPDSDKILLLYAFAELKCGMYAPALVKAETLLKREPENKGAKLIKARAAAHAGKAGETSDELNNIDASNADSEFFSFLAFNTI